MDIVPLHDWPRASGIALHAPFPQIQPCVWKLLAYIKIFGHKIKSIAGEFELMLAGFQGVNCFKR